MSDRKAVNKYYPPDFDPRKGSLNTQRGEHPLRDRARKIGQGILVIRFEMSFNVWCEGCKSHIGKGVRYNAEKKKAGNYYTTPIYSFTMRCHLCSQEMVIETDPKACDYRLVSGVRRKNETWDPATDTQTIELPDDEEKSRRQSDAMYRLEHTAKDMTKAKQSNDLITGVLKMQVERPDQFAQNQLLRGRFREQKKKIRTQEKSDKALLDRASLQIALVPEAAEDVRIARGTRFGAGRAVDEVARRKRRLQASSIFAHNTSAKRAADDDGSDRNIKHGGSVHCVRVDDGGSIGSSDDSVDVRDDSASSLIASGTGPAPAAALRASKRVRIDAGPGVEGAGASVAAAAATKAPVVAARQSRTYAEIATSVERRSALASKSRQLLHSLAYSLPSSRGSNHNSSNSGSGSGDSNGSFKLAASSAAVLAASAITRKGSGGGGSAGPRSRSKGLVEYADSDGSS